MDERVADFVRQHHGGVMVTLRTDGSPHTARVGVGIVDGKLWSSGTQTRIRTKHLRRDPRAGLHLIDSTDPQHWIGLDARVTILDGPDAPRLNLALYRVIAGRDPDDIEEYLGAMVAEQRLIYEFDITRVYGQY
jgi:PPOX class probable F420-dependent enzyme